MKNNLSELTFRFSNWNLNAFKNHINLKLKQFISYQKKFKTHINRVRISSQLITEN